VDHVFGTSAPPAIAANGCAIAKAEQNKARRESNGDEDEDVGEETPDGPSFNFLGLFDLLEPERAAVLVGDLGARWNVVEGV